MTTLIQVGDRVRLSRKHGMLQGCTGEVVGIVRNKDAYLFIVEMRGINDNVIEMLLLPDDFDQVTP